MRLKVAVTGANGYLGTSFCHQLIKTGHIPIPVVKESSVPVDLDRRNKQITAVPELVKAILDCDAVVHLAAITHTNSNMTDIDISWFREVNVKFTESLAKASIIAKVPRFIFVSSIKVNGEKTCGKPFRADDPPNPEGIYSITKYEAEKVLHNLSQDSNFRPIIIRPPLIYGGSAKGIVANLLGIVSKGVPLPLAGIQNKRSLVSLPLMCDLLEICLTHPNAPGHTFLVSDGVVRSTPDIIRMVSSLYGLSPKLFYCPEWILRSAGKMLGKPNLVPKLTSDLEVDIESTIKILHWDPISRMQYLEKRKS